MRTIRYFFVSIFLTTAFSTAYGQCTSAGYGQYPLGTFNVSACNGSAEMISGECYAGEYSAVNVVSGNVYAFSSSVASDYLTIVRVSNNESLVFGVGEQTYLATFTGMVYFYTHTDASCGESDVLRERLVSCSVQQPCLTAPTFGQYPPDDYVPAICDGVTVNEIATDCYAGEFSKVSLVAGRTYTFSSSILTDYLTVSNAIGSIGYVSGTTPITFNNPTDQVVRFYTHKNSACEGENINRGRYVACALPQGCTDGDLYPQEAFTPAVCDGTTPNLVVADAYAGEYALINMQNTMSYKLISTVTTDYITVTNADGSTVLAHGPTPLVFGPPATTGQYRFYIHKDAFCGTEFTDRERIVVCSGALGTVEQAIAGVQLYPNPAKNSLTVSAVQQISDIAIVSIDGKILLHTVPAGLSETLSVEHLQSGTYFVRTTIGGVSGMQAFIKE